MQKSFYEQGGGTYTQVGDYLLPDLVIEESEQQSIGKYGRMRKQYLKEHRKGTYNAMLLQGTLTQHLIDTNAAAMDMLESLVRQMAKGEGATERLKKQDQTEWVRRINNIRNRVEEIVRNELIYS